MSKIEISGSILRAINEDQCYCIKGKSDHLLIEKCPLTNSSINEEKPTEQIINDQEINFLLTMIFYRIIEQNIIRATNPSARNQFCN